MGSLDELGDDVLDLGLMEGSIREGGVSHCLAGRLCTDRPFNMFALVDVMLKASRTNVMTREWGNKLMIFTFTKEKNMD
ncbi:hypothetical protein ACS0TY_010058 [Phlomoides rotata]